MVTKWDLISDAERTELNSTYFGKPCSRCGLLLSSEGDFARHFDVIRNNVPAMPGTELTREHYWLNLGECPDKEVQN